MSVGLTCPQCGSDCSGYDNILIRSLGCGHGVCDKCLGQRYPVRLTASADVVWNLSPGHLVVCPICERPTPQKDWGDWISDRNLLEKAESIRKRVTLVLNGDRQTFKSTPLFYEFLENREEVIYDLVYSQDVTVKRQREEFLKQCEISKQKETLEANERYRKRTEERIKEIVEKEGTFYEQLKVDYSKGFRKELPSLSHPLTREHAELFPQHAEASAKEALLQENQSDVDLLNYLRQHMPTVMTEYTKKPGDSRARAVAGGHSKEVVLYRTQLETFAFRLDWDPDQHL
ncbi:putative CDK-activating kinase assembly factor [Gregarina niphandrodes]|uniref:CDK-activating kinase assembly factor n=1 Tax=Gregarina niphandrodes TaxID=110365 RepID=A0A023B7W9_GRENI|nr:putative CDK-activating kinase assembly factor [Gregarina niphandrodes]EZG68109.1 putative CDK-activating kinase assembly factor [Gregarina niphandrodes]|eukprot:XP_011130094.1 putative CDK-activating kinase assembly factor [Gregarina niphandrodes]